MSGISKKTPLPHWQKVMDQAGCTTATELARKANLPVGTTHNVVYGNRNPKTEIVLKIAKAARIDPKLLLADILDYTLSNRASIAS